MGLRRPTEVRALIEARRRRVLGVGAIVLDSAEVEFVEDGEGPVATKPATRRVPKKAPTRQRRSK
jgi:hypothetical protein